MKTIKIQFGIFAFVLAIGGVYASKMVMSPIGYYYIAAGQIMPVNPPFPNYKECFPLQTCSDTGTVVCTLTTAQTININGTSTILPAGTVVTKSDGISCTVILKILGYKECFPCSMCRHSLNISLSLHPPFH